MGYRNLLCLCFFVLLYVFNSDHLPGKTNQQQIERLIKDGLTDNADRIRELSLPIESTEREELYTKHKQTWGDVGVSAFLNYFPGFGIGSYLQDDTTAGHILAFGHAAGLTLLITGAVQSGSGPPNDLVWAGLYVYAYTSVGGLIRPFFFRSSYNDNLSKSLRLASGFSETQPPLLYTKYEYRFGLYLSTFRF